VLFLVDGGFNTVFAYGFGAIFNALHSILATLFFVISLVQVTQRIKEKAWDIGKFEVGKLRQALI